MLSQNTKEFREALRACRRAAAFHLFDPNVSLIDIGLRIKERQGMLLTPELTLRAHLKKKLRGAAFESFARKNPGRVINERELGFPVDIIEADYPLHRYWRMQWEKPTRAHIFNPLRGGISISNTRQYGYGTLGGIVEDRETGRTMILSNWHVLAGSSYAKPGLKILQPGFGDGGRLRHTVGYLSRHAINQGIDAAVADLNDSREILPEQMEIGQITGETLPTLEMDVVKSGRSSGITRGIITGIEGVTKIMYSGFERIIRHVAHISQKDWDSEVSAPGDSGSWWIDESSSKAVGLHFAGCDYPEYALAISMPEVLNALNINIVT